MTFSNLKFHETMDETKSETPASGPIPPPGTAHFISDDRLDYLVQSSAADAAMHGEPLTSAEQEDLRGLILEKLSEGPFPRQGQPKAG